MSTLTSSPSPAASPRNTFHIQQRHYSSSRSPRASPRPYTTVSPKRSFNAPTPATSAPRQIIERFVESGPVAGAAPGSYVDAGTQYSPEGYPPTAGRSAVAKGHAVQEEGSARKRKSDTQSEPHRQPMSETGTAAGSSSAARPAAHAPAEPDPRRDPSRVATPAGSSTAGTKTELPERIAGEPQPEPQEARTTAGHSSAPKRSRAEPTDVIKSMPRAYETCNPKDLGVLISNMLMELIRLNDQIPLRDGRLTRFHSRAPPGISVSDYLQRLIQHATLSPPIMLSMVLTVHRFLITAATVAAKGLSDSFWTNPTYARIGGIPVSELATLELEFLQKVHWKIVPKPEILEEYYRSLVERTEGFELEPGSDGSSSSLDESDDDGSPVIAASTDVKMEDEPT
ncbi:Pho80p cyclin [Elasticomyces elasticus]|nr:Pho80p cyclin [Elasticomyces elasticus]KAK4980284.1 Pho80p cyclin [Elasticomyces elasticus]